MLRAKIMYLEAVSAIFLMNLIGDLFLFDSLKKTICNKLLGVHEKWLPMYK
ncbi:MAG: hypothetical protein OCD02_16950 [Spirochaetaceae bacterium]